MVDPQNEEKRPLRLLSSENWWISTWKTTKMMTKFLKKRITHVDELFHENIPIRNLYLFDWFYIFLPVKNFDW